MVRAGFTAIASGRIRFGRDGLWYSDDEPIPNRAIRRLFSRALTVGADGRGRLRLGGDEAEVIIEDTPWVVTRVEGSPAAGFTVVLNDETREPLDPGSLRVGPEDVLYCRVKGGAHEARFLRPPYYDLMRHAETDGPGRVVLPVGPARVPIAGRSA
jgi:hypothetical protein